MFVYSPVHFKNLQWKSNSELISEKLVFDAHITSESWCLETVEVEKLGSIFVINDIIETIEYTPLRIGDPKYLKANGKLDTYLYNYYWK